jgi:hypothetical protein
MVMVMEMQRFPSPQAKCISDLWVPLSALALCLRQLGCDFDLGLFMKVACFDQTKAVEGGTTA